MRSSHLRAVMEEHLADFFLAVPDAKPVDFHPAVSPIFAMGRDHGLTVVSVMRYAKWLHDTNRASDAETGAMVSLAYETGLVLGTLDQELQTAWKQVIAQEPPQDIS